MGRCHKNGVDRGQFQLLPAYVDDYVGADNPVRGIDVFVDSLDLANLGFGDTQGVQGAA